ncbi:hypothetical protein D3C78_1431100 [compost metagenome]
MLENIEALPHVAVIGIITPEQPERLDIAIGIHHAAGKHGGGFRRFFGMVADAWHEITRQQREDRHPDEDDDRKPPVQPADQEQHGDGINADEPDAFHQRSDEIARRLPARPDLGDDAA